MKLPEGEGHVAEVRPRAGGQSRRGACTVGVPNCRSCLRM
jgi:hypothetical protein